MSKEAYLQTVEGLLQEQRVKRESGLSSAEVVRRRKQFGANTLPRGEEGSVARLFFARFKDLLIIVLLAAAGLSVVLGHYGDAIIIGVAIAIDVALSFAQLWRTERTLEALREHVQPVATVLRDGKLQHVPARELVIGDIVEVQAGERVPADGRVIQAQALSIREAELTGESDDVEKTMAALETRTPMANRRNMLYMGTNVVVGSGRMMVTTVGTQTEFGKIAQVLKAERSPDSPLSIKLSQIGLQIGMGVLLAVGLLFILGLVSGQSLSETLFTSITLVVSSIPEDLTMILTISLTIGVSRILKKKGVVRDLRSGETLGAATVICTDKTGTLTTGEMEATHFDFMQGTRVEEGSPGKDPLHALALTGLSLLTDARKLDGEDTFTGSATETATLRFTEKLGVSRDRMRELWKRRDALSFSSEWKYRVVLADHPTQARQFLFVTGAPEVLLSRSSMSLSKQGETRELTSVHRHTLQRKIEEYAKDGKRLIGVGVRRNLSQSEVTHDDVHDLLFLGVLVIEDPLRANVEQVVQETLGAGIGVKIVTGDHPATAQAIARKVGLTSPEETVLTSELIERMSDVELRDAVEETRIFARVTPLDKQRIIKALQSHGHVVAMTGDGVNDAVALKGADVGVAMGSGKDIAKEAADLVLLDDSFATIAASIKEGRVIRDNIRKVIAFLLSTNMAEVAIFFASLAMRLPLPLLPAQILWINLVTDGTSDVALSLEPAEERVMKRKPDDPRAPLISGAAFWQMVYTGLVMTAATMALYWYSYRHLGAPLEYAQTMAFTFIAVSSLVSVWSFRSLGETMYRRGFLGNPWVFGSLGVSLLLQLSAVYVPGLQRFFGTVGLGFQDWVLILAISIGTLFIIDARKFFVPHRHEFH